MSIEDRINGLSDNQAVWAVDYVGRTIAANLGTAPTVLARQMRQQGFDPDSVPAVAAGKVVGGQEAEARAGTIARYALRAGLTDKREDVRRIVEAAVNQASEPEVTKELVTVMLIGGALMLGLAVLAKLEITKDGKVVLHPGLPDIDKAAKAVGEFVTAALGG